MFCGLRYRTHDINAIRENTMKKLTDTQDKPNKIDYRVAETPVFTVASDVVIDVQNVTKIYGNSTNQIYAAKQVAFQIYQGEFVGLVGPSGSGKTTMLAVLAALLHPTEGQVTIDGQDLNNMKENERVRFRHERIGFTFQANNLVPYLNVIENVELMLRLNNRLNKTEHERAITLLERLGLNDRLKSLPSQLSGGQRQRVAIARSLIHNPSVVLADEPTASLDTERAFQVTQLYADLIHEQNKSGIMVTHDLRMCRYVDKLIQMKDGQVTGIYEGRQAIEQAITNSAH
jgi:putative ABC transport system ATP-binding protein